MESIFEKRLTVTPDYCDASGALSPLAAFTIFQGIAAQHAEVLGIGSSAMAKKGEFWLTVHTRVDLFERAYLMDELTVRTWAEACSERDVRTYRSYTLSRGEAVIARGKTEWAILGPEQKIIRFGDSGFPKDYPFPAETAIPEKLQRFHEKFEDADLFSHMTRISGKRCPIRTVNSDVSLFGSNPETFLFVGKKSTYFQSIVYGAYFVFIGIERYFVYAPVIGNPYILLPVGIIITNRGGK